MLRMCGRCFDRFARMGSAADRVVHIFCGETAMKKRLIDSILFVILSAAFLLFFSYYTSPISWAEGFDAAFFRLVGQGMTKGMLPYRDFFDMKGPYLFLLEFLSQKLVYGRLGIFLVQCVFMALSFALMDRSHTVLCPSLNRWIRGCMLLPSMAVMAITLQGGNLTEELCLPPVLLCMALGIRYCGTMEQLPHPWQWGMIYGVCFGVISLIRVTNAVSVCAVVLTILLNLLFSCQWKSVLQNTAAFLAGLFLSFLPALLYGLRNGILSEMLYQVFGFGFAYAEEGGLFSPFFLTPMGRGFFVILFLPTAGVLFFSRNRTLKWLAMIDLAALTAALSMGNQFLHYYTLTVPHLVLVGAVLVSAERKEKKPWTIAGIAAVLLCLVCLLPSLCINTYSKVKYYAGNKNAADWNAIRIAERIPEDEKNDVLGYEVGSGWYVSTGTLPAVRFCDWQNHYLELVPQMRDELCTRLSEDPPKWIVTGADFVTAVPDFLREILSEQYTEADSNSSYILWNCVSR